MARVCIFVDGENFRHSIVDLFPKFNQAEYLPKAAEWTQLFDWIAQRSTADPQRIRTYWYVIRTLDFYPYHYPEPTKEPETVRKLLSQNGPYKAQLDAIANDSARTTRMAELVKELRERQTRMERRFAGWIAIQDGIAARHDAVEFRRAGAISCNVFQNNRLGPEKAVDVKLACDLIWLKDIYDVAVIVSGDQDYVPAVEIVKDYGKRIVNVAFQTRDGRLLPGGARRLNQTTDWSLRLQYADVSSFLNVPV